MSAGNFALGHYPDMLLGISTVRVSSRNIFKGGGGAKLEFLKKGGAV